MKEAIDLSKLLELQQALPGRVHAAAQALREAEQRLAQILVRRAAGQATRGSHVSVARMALCKAQRDAEDLQRIQSALPAMLEVARAELGERSNPPVLQIRPGAREAQTA